MSTQAETPHLINKRRLNSVSPMITNTFINTLYFSHKIVIITININDIYMYT